MKWIKLRIYKGEDLLSEVEQVESKYDNLINEVRCSDINDNKAKIEFLSFREEIEQRIIELDEFYQLNINDSRISIFEKVRNKLALLLDININSEEGNKIILKRYGKTFNSFKPSLYNFGKSKSSQKYLMPKKSKLSASSSLMRQSSMKKSASLFGE